MEESHVTYEEEEYNHHYGDDDSGSLRNLLEQKDRDLMLAAELGKALLEKNSDLEKKIEQVNDEYSQRIEELEQERHGLHLKLENLEGEYEATVKELQYDIGQVKEELTRNKHEAYHNEKSRLSRIQELTSQNERLVEELQQTRNRERQYEIELQDFKDREIVNISAKQACQIEILQEQISVLKDQKSNVERNNEHLCDEKESLLVLLDEAQDKIKVLERQKLEHEEQLRQKDDEIRELHERNSHLNVQIDHLTEKASNSSGHSMTLYNELSQLPGNQEVSMATGSPLNPYPPSMFGDDDDIECDDDDFLMTSSSPMRTADDTEVYQQKQENEMEDEIVQAYKHLRQICHEIKSQLGDRLDGSSSTSDETGSSLSDDTGSLNNVVLELRDTIYSAIEQTKQTQTTHISEIQSLQHRVGELEHDLTECQTSLHKLRDQLQVRDIHLQQKSHKITELSKQVSSQHEDIKILSNQRDKLQDMLASDTAKPQMYSAMALLRHARRERDAAIDRRYGMEKELQQSKYEIIVLNHQLMEAIHQKNKVSQLLDQWQSDMANLLGVQVDQATKSSMNIQQQQQQQQQTLSAENTKTEQSSSNNNSNIT
ncbi:coiled-coil domain containing protein 64 [Mactra antiquata]